MAQVLNFEDEIKRCTDVNKAQELTKSQSLRDFKSAVNKMKDSEFRKALERHKLDVSKLWTKEPPKSFDFIEQGAETIIIK